MRKKKKKKKKKKVRQNCSFGVPKYSDPASPCKQKILSNLLGLGELNPTKIINFELCFLAQKMDPGTTTSHKQFYFPSNRTAQSDKSLHWPFIHVESLEIVKYIALDKMLFCFQFKSLDFFLFLHDNICCGYSLEAPQRGASNKYPQHMFSWRNKKIFT